MRKKQQYRSTLNTWDKNPQHAKNAIIYNQRTGKRTARKVLKVEYIGKKGGFHKWNVYHTIR